jgi:thymidylate synthase (FAD)
MEVKCIAKPRPTLNFIDEESLDARGDQLDGCDSENLIEFAGRICYDSLGTGRNSADYHAHILDVGHGSVMEHAQFSFLVKGVSRGLTHELVRHRVGVAISQRSTRYVDESESEVVKHPIYKEMRASLSEDEIQLLDEVVEEAAKNNRELYKMVDGLCFNFLIKEGVDKPTAKKQARGAARLFLENGIETELVWSANVRTLRHVIELRGSKHADAEIQELAVKLLGIMLVECPAYFSDYKILPDGSIEKVK